MFKNIAALYKAPSRHCGEMSIPKLTGVSTEVWGPKAWGFLHAIAFSYPADPTPNEKESVYNLICSLEQLLPCKRCRKHYAEYMKGTSQGISSSTSDHLSSGNKLSRWLVELHNHINVRLNKPIVEFDKVALLYSGDYICPPESVPRPRGSLLADLCDRVGSPEKTLEMGLPPSLEGCFSSLPGGNTGIAMMLVGVAISLVIIATVVSCHSRNELTRQLEREIMMYSRR